MCTSVAAVSMHRVKKKISASVVNTHQSFHYQLLHWGRQPSYLVSLSKAPWRSLHGRDNYTETLFQCQLDISIFWLLVNLILYEWLLTFRSLKCSLSSVSIHGQQLVDGQSVGSTPCRYLPDDRLYRVHAASKKAGQQDKTSLWRAWRVINKRNNQRMSLDASTILREGPPTSQYAQTWTTCFHLQGSKICIPIEFHSNSIPYNCVELTYLHC